MILQNRGLWFRLAAMDRFAVVAQPLVAFVGSVTPCGDGLLRSSRREQVRLWVHFCGLCPHPLGLLALKPRKEPHSLT